MTNLIISIIINIAVSNAPPPQATNYLLCVTNQVISADTNKLVVSDLAEELERTQRTNAGLRDLLQRAYEKLAPTDPVARVALEMFPTNHPSRITEWVGEPAVHVKNPWGPSIGWLPDTEMGLRSDGVMVWRRKQ